MVAVGNTVTLPVAAGTPRMRLLTPLSITMEVAPLVTQVSVAASPEVMLDGEAYSAAVGREPVAGGGVMLPTVIVVLAELLPAELVAVREKVMLPEPVVFTARLPDTGTVPKPAMLADVASSVFQFSVVEPPAATLDGLAVNESMVGSGPDAGGGVTGLATVTMADRDTELEPLVASSKYVIVDDGFTVWLPLTGTSAPFILAPVAFVVLQVSTAVLPAAMLVG